MDILKQNRTQTSVTLVRAKQWVASLLIRYPHLLSPVIQQYHRVLASRHILEQVVLHGLLITLVGTFPFLFFEKSVDSSPLELKSVIVVDEINCTLAKAIVNANDNITGQHYPECASGDAQGPDTISLNADVLLTTPFVPDYFGSTGLPVIYSEITIEGNGHSIFRDEQSSHFRLITNTGDGHLTIRNAILSGGSSGPLRVGGAIWNKGGNLTIINTTISNNRATGGAGIFTGPGELTIINSTISGNVAEQFGGGIAVDFGKVDVIGSTITFNEVEAGFGGGMTLNSVSGIELSIANSIISGNIAYSASIDPVINSAEIHSADEDAIIANHYNVFSHAGLTTQQAFTGFVPKVDDVDASGNGQTPFLLDDILSTTIGFNGGSTLTHALVANSPAIDISSSAECEGLTDQRGFERNLDGNDEPSNNECDAGAFEYGHEIFFTPTPTVTKTPESTSTPTLTPSSTLTPEVTPDSSSTSTIVPANSPTPILTPTKSINTERLVLPIIIK